MTHGFVWRPSSTAFFASNPAPIKTFGLDVLVHDVIAAINIDPSSISKSVFSTFELIFSFRPVASLKTFLKLAEASFNKTLS